MNEELLKFMKKRPPVIAAFGYGSGVFKQANSNTTHMQIDIILIVEDLKNWHKENMRVNPKDYSFLGKNFLKHMPVRWIKGCTGISYQSNISEGNNIFKYGVIEFRDFKENLLTWNSFYVAGRFHKMVLPVITNSDVTHIIEVNRKNAFLVSVFILNQTGKVTLHKVFETLCSLSYYGDTRMKIAENPHKIHNIVEGSYEELKKEYEGIIKGFGEGISLDGDTVIIGGDMMNHYMNQLPKSIKNDIQNNNGGEKRNLSQALIDFFTAKNKKESLNQTIKGICTNGIMNSIKYVIPKLKKRFSAAK